MTLSFRFAILTAALAGFALAQAPQTKKPVPSPPATATLHTDGHTVTIAYSSPAVRGRQIFGPGGLVSHDANYPVWRAGANSATALHTDTDLMLGDLRVPKGNYTLYALVQDPDHWQLIVNKQTGQWGLTYDAKQDLGRVPMTMAVPPAKIERLQYILTPDKLTLEWDLHVASVPLRVAPQP